MVAGLDRVVSEQQAGRGGCLLELRANRRARPCVKVHQDQARGALIVFRKAFEAGLTLGSVLSAARGMADRAVSPRPAAVARRDGAPPSARAPHRV